MAISLFTIFSLLVSKAHCVWGGGGGKDLALNPKPLALCPQVGFHFFFFFQFHEVSGLVIETLLCTGKDLKSKYGKLITFFLEMWRNFGVFFFFFPRNPL
jgi:hypothetical protein